MFQILRGFLDFVRNRRVKVRPRHRGEPIAVDLYMRSDDSQPWKYVKRFRTREEAENASSLFAAEAVFNAGDVMFFEARFDLIFEETPPRAAAGPYRP